MRENILVTILTLIILAILYAISWAVCVGTVYLICLCIPFFSFNLAAATGIWLIFVLIKWFFGGKGK